MRVSTVVRLTAYSVLLLGIGVSAQQPPAPPPTPDTPAITAMIEAARKAAAKYAQPAASTLVVVGDRAAIEADLAKLHAGEIVVLDAEGQPAR